MNTVNRQLLHTPEGVRDIYGKEYTAKLGVEEKIHQQLGLYGYQDIQTPTFEFFDVFSREIGTTPSKELYKFFDKEGNTLVLRPDFTPSMARCAATYFMEENVPIRFSYLGNTFTNTSNLQGKLKEVTQMGAEMIGDGSVQADAEMIAMTAEALLSTGLTEFQITIGQVEYFKGLCTSAGIEEDMEEQLRELISGKNFFGAEELLQEKGISEQDMARLLGVTDCFGGMEALEHAEKLAGNKRSENAVKRLKELYHVLCSYGVEKYVSFDLGMLSKYHYYTGVIFKVFTYGVGDAIAKGGRYDSLLGYFGKQAPAIGFVVVIDDLMLALQRQHGESENRPNESIVLTYTVSNYDEMLQQARKLRRNGQRVALIPKQ